MFGGSFLLHTLNYLMLGRLRIDADLFAVIALGLKTHITIRQGEQGIVPSPPTFQPGEYEFPAGG